MTTIMHASVPGGPAFGPTSIHSASYPNLDSLNTSTGFPGDADSKSSYLHAEYDGTYSASAPSSVPSSPAYTHSMFSRQDSYDSTPASSLSLDNGEDRYYEVDDDDDDDEEESGFPAFGQSTSQYKKPRVDPSKAHGDEQQSSRASSPVDDTSDLRETVNDDQAIEAEPTRHVDYLSHEWKEEDIWSSWRYIVSRRSKIQNCVRLENAAWRTWMKAKYNLKTVSPETLNWLKDCDVTWLYGPLQTDAKKSLMQVQSPPPSQLSTSSSFLSKKPILKKKSASAAILERSRSTQSLLQRAGEIIRVQQASPAFGRPILGRGESDFTLPSYTGSSVANTPAEHDTSFNLSHRYSFGCPESATPADQKHVLFNEEVRQVQAIDSEDDDEDKVVRPVDVYESDEDDDGGLVMAPTRSRSSTRSSTRSTPRSSFSSDSKTIVPLPSTTLKYRTDTPEPVAQSKPNTPIWQIGKALSPSPSQETLRPPRPSRNFLIDDDPEVSDDPWYSQPDTGYSPYDENELDPGPNMRRTPSGMFMPYDEDEEETAINKTLIGQAMYAVHTFKDIAHVVWNVGWSRR